MFSIKIKLIHRYFKSSPYICNSWINRVHFLNFSSLSPHWYRLSSSRCHHAAMPCHISFTLSKDELAASASSFIDASSCHLPSRAKTDALNSHHRRRPPSPAVWLPLSTTIKKSSQSCPPSHHSTTSSFGFLHSQSTTSLELHPPSSFPFTTVPPQNDTHGDELADSLSLPVQLISMWIYVKIYFKIPPHRAGVIN
jgi:hypothetical protein